MDLVITQIDKETEKDSPASNLSKTTEIGQYVL